MNKAKYPTKKEIMAKPYTIHDKKLIKEIILWKEKFWGLFGDDDLSKRVALSFLVDIMGAHYVRNCQIIFRKTPTPYYDPREKLIVMNKSLSIISTMHEFAHHLFGKSELTACRWSIHLFRRTFPIAYKKLIWRGHRLVKNEKKICSKCGSIVKKEKDKNIDYPYYCPQCDENLYSFETQIIKDNTID